MGFKPWFLRKGFWAGVALSAITLVGVHALINPEPAQAQMSRWWFHALWRC